MGTLQTPTFGLQAGDREDGPAVSGPGQFVRDAVGERDPGPHGQVFDGSGDEDLGRLGIGGNTADDVNRDSPDLVTDQVHFPCVNPDSSDLPG